MHPDPSWLVAEPATDTTIGVIRSGKEAQVDLVERTGADGRTCLIARKRYLPREVKHKGELESLGFQGASTFHADASYREGRTFRRSRDRRAVAKASSYGRELLRAAWADREYDVLRDLWEAGAPVPFPVERSPDVLDLEYLGDRDGAAPQLRAARLDAAGVASAFEQVVDGLRAFVAAGYAHGDLSSYNLLWWDDRVWFIDVPQAVDLAVNLRGLDLLHRDVVNVCTWFQRRGARVDPEQIFADLLTHL